MLELLQSNRMSFLLETLCERLMQPQDPFEPVIVVVQSQGIGQWLKVELANRLGIAANIECLLPAELIWRLYQRVLPQRLGAELPDESPYSRQLMSWRLMQSLPAATEPSIQSYLKQGDDHQLRLFQLSHVIAGLFDQYLIYRPDWIQAWDSGKDDQILPWQSILWRELNRQTGMDPRFHRANLHQLFVSSLTDSQSVTTGLPCQINVLGVSSLPAMHLETLQAVANHHQVCVYFLNPCEHYWGDIETEKNISKRSIRSILNKQTSKSEEPLLEDDYLEVGNPLLSSTGKQGREFLELLLESQQVQAADLFQPVTGDTVLDQIHRDILNLEFGGQFFDATCSPAASEIRNTDRSVEIHCVHSRMREVEVLLDQLLAYIDRSNGSMQASDIIVMAPDITQYAPFIQATFHGKIAYSITDKPAIDESTMLVAFNKLISLPDARMTATEVMDLIEVPAIANKLDLSENDLGRIQQWIVEAGIRFEVDGQHKTENWHLPADDYNSWRFGLDRLLLGLIMEADAGLHSGIAPVDLAPSDAELLGVLCDFVDLLAKHRTALSQDHTPQAWQSIVSEMLFDLMLVSTDEELGINQIMDCLDSFVHQTELAHYNELVTPRLFRYWIQEQLRQPPQNRGFVSGGITFATLVPMRSIPYNTVCLIGMNDREFPREDKPLSFDLMTRDYRKGDRSRRNDDRYLFLEAILSATSNLYVSYIGRGQRDNKVKPPSELVSELKDYIDRLYSNHETKVHPLQPFSPNYYNPDHPLQSYATHWYQAISEVEPVAPFLAQPIAATTNKVALTDLNQLTRFYRHPTQYFFNEQLQVYFRDEQDSLKDTEAFALDGLERYQLADSALSVLLSDGAIDDWTASMRASGSILPGSMGQQQLDREAGLAMMVAQATQSLSNAQPKLEQFEININQTTLKVELKLYDGHYLIPRTGELKPKQKIQAWIEHLALCVSGSTLSTGLISRTGSGNKRRAETLWFHPVPAEQATQLLSSLIGTFERGSRLPISFFPAASFKFATTGSLAEVKKTLMDERSFGEAFDVYNSRAFDFTEHLDDVLNESFEVLAMEIWQPVLEFTSSEQEASG